jgi:hypothetical protein
MFIIDPDPYSLPCYRIGPFKTRDLALNHNLPDNNLIDEYFDKRFDKKDFIYTENGRKAISIALSWFNLQENDIVTILTTTGNFYISSCVTNEIERYCKWNRTIVPETTVIFVNHEFGYPFYDLHRLKTYNLPIIEDCAGSFFSNDMNNDIGEIGDFVIYSFPKMFPIQIGGLLVSKYSGGLTRNEQVDKERLRYIKNVLSSYIESKEDIIQKRFYNYSFLISRFEKMGFSGRFKLDTGSVPGVFMFRTDRNPLNLKMLKQHFYAHGIQCSVFYGEDSFFIPVHQALDELDMIYFSVVMESFIKRNSG